MARRRLGYGEEDIILYVGRIEPLKGIDRLLQAVGLMSCGKKPRLVIIGGDENSREEMSRLKGLACDLGISDSVTFTGLVKHEELADYYNAASLFALPSHYETFGLVALESLACGTPVIATDVGDLKSIIRQGETGYIIDDNSPEVLASKMSLLLRSYERASAPEIRASVSRFAWPNIAEQVYNDVIAMCLSRSAAGCCKPT
jgi:D-inositol-3-phosphate glycosyltransferase